MPSTNEIANYLKKHIILTKDITVHENNLKRDIEYTI